MHVGGTARCLCYANANPLLLRLEPCSRAGRAAGVVTELIIHPHQCPTSPGRIHLISEPYLHLVVCEMQQTCVHAHRFCA